MKTILATGGTGYIGSHMAAELIHFRYQVIIADDLSNSSQDTIERIEKITGRRPVFYYADVTDKGSLRKIFQENDIDTVMHFAGYKEVGESVREPVKYYRNNLDTTLTLLEVMKESDVKKILFSSSATAYGNEHPVPFTETMERGKCTNPYGWTKSMIEQILSDTAAADSGMSVVLLRYFNPIGAHESGLIGERPSGTPNNLMPYITQVAAGKQKQLYIFGDDYPTKDGTGVRDYIHVMDLARGHVDALAYLFREHKGFTVNLGTGVGYSVLDVVHAFEKACGKPVPYRIAPRRAGDVPLYYADPSLAASLLGWKARYDLDDMCRDYWNWQSSNPDGYV